MAQEELRLDGPITRVLVLESLIDRTVTLDDSTIARELEMASHSEMEYTDE